VEEADKDVRSDEAPATSGGPGDEHDPGPELRLVVVSEAGKGTEFPVSRDETVIGQEEGSDIVLGDDRFASGKHARIVCEGDQLFLEDLDSLNGTYVRITGRVPLEPGTEVLVGTTRLHVGFSRGEVS